MDPVYLIAYASSISPLIPMLLSARLKHPMEEVKLIIWLLAISFLSDLISFILASYGFNTYPLGNLYFLLQAVILFVIYQKKLPVSKVIFWMCTLFLVAFFILNFFFFQGSKVLNSFSVSISGLMLIIIALIYFNFLIRSLPETFVHRIPMVWINIAVLVYYSGNLFLFIFNNYFTQDPQGNQRIMWILHNSLNISKNILFLVAIWQNLRKSN